MNANNFDMFQVKAAGITCFLYINNIILGGHNGFNF